MTKLQALKKSEQKWADIHAGTGTDQGQDNCSLCFKYKRGHDCTGCPVFEKTNQINCRGTPYQKWINHQAYQHIGQTILKTQGHCKECERLAFSEWEFLYDLYLEELLK